MTIPRKNTLLCATLTIVLATLLTHRSAFADGLTFGREKLRNSSKTTGDFNLQNRFSLQIDGVSVAGVHTIEGIESGDETPVANAGASVSFTVPEALVSRHGPFTYQWQKNGVKIPGATGVSYRISRVKSSDAATYTVVATNAAGSATSAGVRLTVSSATSRPVITVQPTSRMAAVGSSVTFTAAASGSPTPTYQWKKDTWTIIPGATRASYTISRVSASDAGTYTVVVSNSVGAETSTGAVLKVGVSSK
jgi:hypothetical protein